ncbi:MAG TPA: hypothetical protein VI011_20075 [Asanoa sp.]
MTGARDVDASIGARPAADRPNYTGAVYGSLLAGSVVVGAGAGGTSDLPPLKLAGLLVATGLVFWLAHGYARLVGDQLRHTALGRQEIRRVARHEWPLFQTALPPAATAVVFGLLGASNTAAAWAALTAAVVEQVGWATFITVRSGATRRLVLVTALVNLGLGLLIVLLKATLHH